MELFSIRIQRTFQLVSTALAVFSLFYNGILTENDLSEFDDRTREAFLEHRRLWNPEL